MTDGAMLKSPFKWAGGKSRIAKEIDGMFPDDFRSHPCDYVYVEPFVGGGSMLFYMLQNYELKGSVICDLNKDLINAYMMIKYDADGLVSELRRLEDEYFLKPDGERMQVFLKYRKMFNEEKASLELFRPVEWAACFMFLNRTCFNGLWRVNSEGLYNVPFGKYANPTICDEEKIRGLSELLKDTVILWGSYESARDAAFAMSARTVWYFDPPYRDTFTGYTGGGFDDADQVALAGFVRGISDDGAAFAYSNSYSEDGFFQGLFEGYEQKRITAMRAINPKRDRSASEILIGNKNVYGNVHQGKSS